MKVIRQGMPDITGYMQYVCPISLDNDATIIVVFKQLYRDDDVLVDIYLNEMAEDTKIISGRKLTADSVICHPRNDINFPYYIKCTDIDDINTSIKNYNVHKFYLQFTYFDGEDWNL